MAATLHILKEAGRALEIETIEIGEKVYLRGNTRRHRAELVGIAAPHQGVPEGADHDAAGRRLQEPERHDAQDARASTPTSGPASSYHPFVETKHPVMDVVIVRENEEDLYAGIEHRPDRRGRPDASS